MLRIAPLVVAVLAVASTARADRSADFSASLFGAAPTGMRIGHDVNGWTLHVQDRPGAAEHAVAIAAPPNHGDYLVFVSPSRDRVAWILTGDVRGLTAATPAVWIYATAGRGALLASIPLGQLFSTEELGHLPKSTAGTAWMHGAPVSVTSTIVLPSTVGAPLVIDLGATTPTAKRAKR